MQQIIQQIAILASQADETDEERADRLEECAEETGADAHTLFEVEEDLRGLARLAGRENEETVAKVEQIAQQFAPMMGMDPEQAGELVDVETVASLGTQYALAHPEETALMVKTVHEAFERRGLYDDLDTETPTPGELARPIDVPASVEDP
jgi:hypothetical protein